ncbi:MAG: aspartyl-tRNA synthetase 2, mitochondrial [Sclerophora amabilis]|nr:MAG: aspartyl-tRNA synthetase 2, mitochondrial [Sclerophora amabilis]
METTVSFPPATHNIKELTGEHAPLGQEVIIHGYLGERADIARGLSFVFVNSKELNCSIQIISSLVSEDAQLEEVHLALRSLTAHSPVVIRGTLKSRQPSKKDSGNGSRINDHEIQLQEIYSLNVFPKDIVVKSDTKFSPEERHLQLRTDRHVRDALEFRARATTICRNELTTHGFTEIETPLLFKSTPEGAREFLVPTRRKGLAYALPQSPQQYKQILMASGVSKYYQIAKCFRDEDLRADRQPEFTQLDLEMSFATGEDVMKVIEILVRKLWGDLLGVHYLPQTFPAMSYQEAMSRYGSDKPDVRLGAEITSIGHLVPADLIGKLSSDPDPIIEMIKFKVADNAKETRNFVNSFMDSPHGTPFQENPEGGPGIFIIDSRKPLQGLQSFGFEAAERVEELLNLEDGDLVILQARKKAPHTGGSTPLGNLRLALHRAAVAQGYLPSPDKFEFLWITDFPLFSPTNEVNPGQGGAAGLSSTHHPFTSPKTAEDVDLLSSDPSKVKGEHYDLVVNGVELGGGSRRIHNSHVQEFILRDVLKMSPTRLKEFSHLLEVLRAGCPPHAGIALGFDRLIAVMLGRQSIRDVIAFPKSGKGEDLLVKSPGVVSQEALGEYHLQVQD